MREDKKVKQTKNEHTLKSIHTCTVQTQTNNASLIDHKDFLKGKPT